MIKVVPDEGFDEADVQKIVRRYQEVLGPEAMIKVEEVNEILLLPSGKWSYIRSEVREAQIDET